MDSVRKKTIYNAEKIVKKSYPVFSKKFNYQLDHMARRHQRHYFMAKIKKSVVMPTNYLMMPMLILSNVVLTDSKYRPKCKIASILPIIYDVNLAKVGCFHKDDFISLEAVLVKTNHPMALFQYMLTVPNRIDTNIIDKRSSVPLDIRARVGDILFHKAKWYSGKHGSKKYFTHDQMKYIHYYECWLDGEIS